MEGVGCTREVHEMARALKTLEQIPRRYRVTIAERIGAGVQQGTVEHIRIAERDPQRDARSARESADEDALLIYGIFADEVFFCAEGKRYAAAQHVGGVTGLCRGDEDDPIVIEL